MILFEIFCQDHETVFGSCKQEKIKHFRICNFHAIKVLHFELLQVTIINPFVHGGNFFSREDEWVENYRLLIG